MDSNSDQDIRDNLRQVRERIAEAAISSGRKTEDIRLIAVSKTVGVHRITEAVTCGVTDLGENYVQEARDKIEALPHLKVSWHMIGHLQTNKAKYAVRRFDLIHTIDSLKLAAEIDRRASAEGKVQPILVQVDVSGEDARRGIDAENAVGLVEKIGALEHTKICGLMTMPPYFNDPERVRPAFAALRRLRDRIGALNIPGVVMDELSMGMTGDFEVAIQEGATMVRVGTALFGKRERE